MQFRGTIGSEHRELMSEGLNHISAVPALCSSSMPGLWADAERDSSGWAHLPPGAHSQGRGDKGVKGNDRLV